jgi:hypothetical protein
MKVVWWAMNHVWEARSRDVISMWRARSRDAFWLKQVQHWRNKAELSMGEQREGSEPVTPEQRTTSMEQVTPEKADGGQRAFSLGPAAIEERSERAREVGTQTTEGTTADRECAATATEKGEIQELKKVVGELLAQVQSAGVLAQAVAGWWTVASPEMAAQGAVHSAVHSAWAARNMADTMAANVRNATTRAEKLEAEEQARNRERDEDFGPFCLSKEEKERKREKSDERVRSKWRAVDTVARRAREAAAQAEIGRKGRGRAGESYSSRGGKGNRGSESSSSIAANN